MPPISPRRSALLLLAALLLAPFMLVLTPVAAQAATAGYANTYTFDWAGYGGYSSHSATVGNGGTLKIGYALSGTYYTGYDVKPRLTLQRKVGSGAWRTVKSGLTYKEGAVSEVTTPSYSTEATKKVVYYRVKSTAYNLDGLRGVAHTAYSPRVKLTYENQRRYTGLAAQAYGYIRSYCATSAVHVVGLDETEAGQYDTPNLMVKIDRADASMPAAWLRTVALHECAHERQFVNWGKTAAGWIKMEKAMAKHFKHDATPAGVAPTPAGTGESLTFDPVEHAADCAALALNPAGYLGYGGYCNATELHYGKLLLKGHKF